MGFKKLLELVVHFLSSIDEVISRRCKLRKIGEKIRLLKALFVKKIALSELNQVAVFCLYIILGFPRATASLLNINDNRQTCLRHGKKLYKILPFMR